MQSELFDSSGGSGAEISEDGLYRYRLWRVWDAKLPAVVWVMLNPSTADGSTDDATIRRCIGFAKKWGFGGILVINLFALRSTNPVELMKVADPVGPKNVQLFYDMVDSKPEMIVAAWGNHVPPGHQVHVDAIARVLRSNDAKCLGRTKSGQPKHPVRLPYETLLRSF